MSTISPIRQGYRTITPYIAVSDAKRAHEFYQRAFGATIVAVLETPGGRIMHGALRIGDSMVVVVDEMPEVRLKAPANGGVCSLLIYGPDADGLFARAVAAGATPIAPVADTFSGTGTGCSSARLVIDGFSPHRPRTSTTTKFERAGVR